MPRVPQVPRFNWVGMEGGIGMTKVIFVYSDGIYELCAGGNRNSCSLKETCIFCGPCKGDSEDLKRLKKLCDANARAIRSDTRHLRRLN